MSLNKQIILMHDRDEHSDRINLTKSLSRIDNYNESEKKVLGIFGASIFFS